MSGHSKWSQIKRQKGVADQKRGATFSKLSRLITLAARTGSDPTMNFQLRMAIDQARSANMPKDNIERAIERASNSGGSTFEQIIFEAYGPEGVAFLIEVATDNRNRATSEIRSVFNKFGGKLAESGSVSYLFNQRGLLIYPKPPSLEEFELLAIESGAEDLVESNEELYIYTNPRELDQVKKSLEKHSYQPKEVELTWEPITTLELSPQQAENLIKLSHMLEELDDVTKVASNFEVAI